MAEIFEEMGWREFIELWTGWRRIRWDSVAQECGLTSLHHHIHRTHGTTTRSASPDTSIVVAECACEDRSVPNWENVGITTGDTRCAQRYAITSIS
jgi:hypothetical protein